MELTIFFDGCHKIYYCDNNDQATIDKMVGYGYEPIIDSDPISVLRDLYENSCGLRFIECANFELERPELSQCEDDLERFLEELESEENEV